MTTFQEKVLKIVKQIPKGKVLTYSQVAKQAGVPNASRAVGTVMANNKDKTIPCHRVIRSDGSIGAYNGIQGTDKSALLKKEGISISTKGKVLLF